MQNIKNPDFGTQKLHKQKYPIIHSVIMKHRFNFSHEFNWENVEILDKERFLTKCLISEMIYIKRQNNNLNLQSDTECLDDGIISISILNSITNYINILYFDLPIYCLFIYW